MNDKAAILQRPLGRRAQGAQRLIDVASHIDQLLYRNLDVR
jgi:hypothetical protein